MTEPNAADDKIATLHATPVVLASRADVEPLAAIVADVDRLIAVEDWGALAPRDIPPGPVHIIAMTRESREIWEAIRSLCVALAQGGRTPRLIETAVPVSMMPTDTITWESLTAASVEKPTGRAPAASTRAVQVDTGDTTCVTATGLTVQMVSATDATGKSSMQQHVVHGWAAWVVEATFIGQDSLNTIEVSYPTENGPVFRTRIVGVLGTNLDRFDWLGFSARTNALPRPLNSPACKDMANAIRRAEGPQGETTLSRTVVSEALGWEEIDGRAVSVRPDAGLSRDGLDPTISGGDSEASKAYVWDREHAVDEERNALRTVLIDMPALMRTPAAWYALIGQHGRAVTPTPGGVAAFLYGTQNNGKTVLGRSGAGFMGAGVFGKGLENFKATANALDVIASQFRAGVCLVDDIPPLISNRRAEEVQDVVDTLVRASHPEGTLKSRATVASGKVGLARRADAHPSVLITTEESLSMLMPLVSTRNRALGIEIVRGQEFESSTRSDDFEALAESTCPTAGYALTRWIAGEIDTAGGLAGYRDALLSRRAVLAAAAKESHPEWDTRTCRSLAGFVIGATQFADAALAIGALDDVEHESFVTTAADAIEGLFVSYARRWLSQSDGIKIVEEIWVEIRKGRIIPADMCKHSVRSGKRCDQCGTAIWSVGKRCEFESGQVEDVPDGGAFIAFSPNDIAEVLRTPSHQRSAEQVKKQLLGIDGAFTHKVRFGGASLRLVLVPEQAFLGNFEAHCAAHCDNEFCATHVGANDCERHEVSA